MQYVQPIRSREQIDSIKKVLARNPNPLIASRNHFLFILGINSALRVGDILRLRVKDVRGKDHLILSEQKTGNYRRMKITPELHREIKKYTAGRSGDEYLIKSREGVNKPLTRTMVYLILRRAGQEVGVGEIGTHTMRKTFGYHFYQKYRDASLLQKIFGHSSPAITLRYIGIDQDMMDKAVENFKI